MKNLAIKVDNKREFEALMKHYKTKGWKWSNKNEPIDFFGIYNYDDVITYEDCFIWPCRSQHDYSVYTIIDFSTFSQLTGVEVVNEVVIEVDNKTTVSVFYDGIKIKDHTGIFYLEGKTLTEIYTAYKSLQS